MASSVLVKCLSHTPLRGLNDPAPEIVAEVDTVLAQAKADVEAFDPELVVIFAPDHYNGLFYDLMPQFVLATAADSVGDYHTKTGPLGVDRDTAMALYKHLLDSDLDIALSHRLQVDHGCTQTLEELTGSYTRYPIVPIIINAAAPPLSPYRRIRRLGEAVGQFIAKLDKRVLVLGTGGLSHEPPVPVLDTASEEIAQFLIAGRNPSPEARANRVNRTVAAGQIYGTAQCPLTPLNAEWDQAFIDLLVHKKAMEQVDCFDIEAISREAGRSSHEIRTWVAAFAALSACGAYEARRDYYRPINEWIAGYAAVSGRLTEPAQA